MPLPIFQQGQPPPQQQDLGQLLQQQHQMVGPNGFGGYMDQNVKEASPVFLDEIHLQAARVQQRQNDALMLARQMKMYNPDMPDHVIGMHIKNWLEQMDNHDYQFRRAMGQNEVNTRNNKIGY